ncbi:chitin synthase 6 [Colletotrichum liriopes]|uniref:chitin synthase n=1 Tax=Colletotrichum liriopes TaxID=708192 RepID=A0AA37LQM9_9PEZI|nr:chitin synthase 6 [Colletotrichum liriopes]
MARPQISRPKSAHIEDKRWTIKTLSQRLSTHLSPSRPQSRVFRPGTPNSWRSQGEWDAYSAASDSRPSTPRTSISSRGSNGKERRKTSGSSLSQDDSYVEKPSKFVTDFGWPILPDPLNPNKKLTPRELTTQRILFILIVFILNIGLAAVACFGNTGLATLIFILFVKCKDFLSSLLSLICLTGTSIYHHFRPPAPVSQRWILSLIPAYSESEEQLIKTVYSLRDNGCEPHKQVMCIVLDGKPRNIKSEFSRIVADIERPYHSLKYKKGTLKITAGFMQDVPVIVIEKVKNSGKKDSLILTHDLFNAPRENMPTYTRLLRTDFRSFDMVFCTDADSVIHQGCVAKLANALARDKNAIATCGLVLVELEPGYEWSFWNLYQQLQYTFGQFVRRRAEGFIGKVTCLPGCVTMVAVRQEMAGAIAKYARPVKEDWVVHHQVQNLGTDRRLTYCMLSQDKKLRTIFVPDAVSETSFKHYVHQRRRWGSNAYFNNYFYFAGENMILITRIAAAIDIARQTLVYYRVLNTILFIRALVHAFNPWDILPLLVVGQFPVIWFCVCLAVESSLRQRAHKIILGFFVNKLVSPFMSIIIFSAVAKNLGNAVWGMSGVTASSAPAAPPKDKLSEAEEGKAGIQRPESPISRPPSPPEVL